MRLTTKLMPVFIFLLLASSLLVTHGCSGKGSGGCPDSAAPDGSTIVGTLGGVISNASGDCYPTVSFVVRGGTNNEPLSDICVEVYASNAAIALHSGTPNCSNVAANPQTAIVTRTDAYGVVTVELQTLPTTTASFSVTAQSGAISGTAK